MTPAMILKVHRVLLAAASLAALSPARAADTPPADGATETIVLKAAHLFDSTGTALKSGAAVVVRGERIVSVGAGAIPAGARVIELGDATLLPGFIDAHTHLTLQLDNDYYRGVYNRVMRFPAEQAMYAALYARRTLEAGFTTVRNVGADDFVDLGLRNGINAGVTEDPHMLTAVHGIGSPGGPLRLLLVSARACEAVGTDRGNLQRSGPMPRGGPLSDEVGCRRHQDRRERWSAFGD